MPKFTTPAPITARIEIGTGQVRILASDRTDTVVDVQPTDPSTDADVEVAEKSRVDLVNGRLSVTAPRPKTWRKLFGRPGSVDVTVELPEGSEVDVDAWADVYGEGRLGDASFDTAVGAVHVGETGRLGVHTGAGDVSLVRASGPVEVSTATGKIRLDAIEGNAVVRTSNGDVTLGEVTGSALLKTANGHITVGRALADVEAKTAAGSIRVDEVVRGTVALETGFGDVEVGVREGTAAWLDISSARSVRSELEPSAEPGPEDLSVEVRVATGWGNVRIRRATSPAPAVG